MAQVGNLRTTISLDSSQFQNSMQGVNRQLRALKQEQRAVTSSGTGFARGVTELRAKADVLTRTLELQRAKVNELRRLYEESRKETGEHTKQTQNLQIEYQKAVAEMNKTENALRGVTAELERQTNPLIQLSEKLERTGKSMKNIGRGMSDVGRTLTTRVTLPIVGLGTAALRTGMDFEAGMSKVQALSGATAEEMAMLSAQSKELGESTVFSATQAAEAQAFLAMAGFKTNEILASMPGLLDLAASSNMDLGRAADIATNILTGFNMEASETGRVADVLAAGASSANTNVEQLGGAMKYVAPVAASLGLEVEGLTAAVGLMSDAGIQGEQAGRQLRQGLLRLASPTGQAADIIEELGIKAFNADGSMKELHEVVGELEKALGDMDDKTRTATLSILFGAESVAGWTALMERGSKELASYTKELENSEGAAERMAKTMQDNAKGSVTEFRSALEGVGIAISEHMLPTFTSLVNKGTELVRKFGELDDETQQQIITMAGLAAAAGPVLMILGNLTTTVGGLIEISGRLIGKLSGAGGLTGVLGRLTNPVGLAITGVGLLAGGIYLWNKRNERAVEVNLELADSMMEQANTIDDLVVRYDELRTKSGLTTEQIGELLDLQHQIENETNPEKLMELQEAYDSIRETSGLTNEELSALLELNDAIIEQTPHVEQTFTDRGNAVVNSTEAVHEYIASLREMALEELQLERIKQLELEEDLLQKNLELKEEFARLEERHNRLIEIGNMSREEIADRVSEINFLLQDTTLSNEEIVRLEQERKDLIQAQNGGLAEVIESLQEEREQLQKNLEENEAKIRKLEEIDNRISEILLLEIDINEQGQEGLRIADEKLQKLYKERDEIQEQIQREGDKGNILQDQLDIINEQIKKHESVIDKIEKETDLISEAKRREEEKKSQIQASHRAHREVVKELEKVNKEAGKEVTKRVKIDDRGEAKSLNERLSETVTKRINVKTFGDAILPSAFWYADGTDYHPGGLAVAGEEGFELARHNDKWAMLTAGVYNLPRGTEVFTHEETKRILRSIRNIPAYANGINSGVNRAIDQFNITQDNSQVVQLLQEILQGIKEGQVIEMDGYIVGRVSEPYITEIQERERRVRKSFA